MTEAMSKPGPLFLGPRIRRLRREFGLTQQQMADDLAISPSYVALLERNQRPVTADLLVRLARTYRLEIADLASEDSAAYARRLEEVLRDPLFADIGIPAIEMADLGANFPSISEAVLRLHGAYTREQRALAEQRDSSAMLPAADPVSETRRFLASQRNYFPALEDQAARIAAAAADAGGLEEWLRQNTGVRVRYMPSDVMMGILRRFDRHHEQLLIDEALDRPARAFQIATHVAYAALRSAIEGLLGAEKFVGEATPALVRRALASYGAAAILLPYDRFVRAAEKHGYDLQRLAREFGCSFEQVAHRLTTLGRPGTAGIPFFFIRVDTAGNVSKRLDGAGFPFAAHGGGCPLWSLHTTFRTPGDIITQLLELPDGERFFSIARTVAAGGESHDRPVVVRSVALVCAAEHAGRTVYARDGLPPPTPIGITCRVCHRAECRARALPPVGRDLLADDYRRDAAPFSFDD